MPTMRFSIVILLLILLLGVITASAQTGAPPLTSQAIDPGLFRDGAIKRYSGTHGAWSYVCDEVAKMKKRFCSLRSNVQNTDGTVIAALTISTGEDGRPAALLRMAGATFDNTGIELVPPPESKLNASPPTAGAVKTKPKTPAPMRIYPAACADGICQLIWTLTTDHIAALSEGRGLKLRYTTPTTASPLANTLRSAATPPSEAMVDARGFAAAVDASVKMAN